jgi:hypothetical protein
LSRLTVCATDPLHVALLAPCLRQADREELRVGSGETPTAALTRGLATSSECWSVLAPEGVVAIFGVCPIQEDAAAVWLLGSDLITAYYREFARRSIGIMGDIRHQYGLLFNFVHPENTVHLRWLQWLGAELGAPTPHPVSGAPFIPFVFDHVRAC